VPSKETSRTLLAEQNDMYARAIAKRESGDFDGAVGAFDHLIAKYPACPLAENALAERMKILATANPPRAMQAAREYLAKYPQGYAREDANTVLGRGVPDR
jgi:outer membrane protein assembly factor BamD (BamD/ComL family)